MRVLFLSSIFPDSSAPTRGTFNAALCRALARSHQVRVVAPRLPWEAYPRFGLRKKFEGTVELRSLNLPVEYPTAWQTPRVGQHLYGVQMWWSLKSSLRQLVREFRPDAVLSYWAHPEGEVGQRVAQLAGVPSAVIVGGSDVLVITKDQRRRSKVQAALAANSAVITVSESLRQSVISLGTPAQQVHTISQGIDPSQFHTHTSREAARHKLGLDNALPQLVWVGRMSPIKGLDLLLESAKALKQSGLDFRLHLLGDGPQRCQFEQQVARENLAEQVRFAGSMPQQDLPDWYRAADLTLLTSRSEGLPNVLRESLACGTPFVSTDVGSIREIAQPEASLLVPGGDPHAFATAIHKMLNPEARAAAAMYQARTWDDCAADVVQLFHTLKTKSALKPAQRLESLQTV